MKVPFRETMLQAGATLVQTGDAGAAARANHPTVPPSVGEVGAAFNAGCAFAAAEDPAWLQHWQHAAQLLLARYDDQAKRSRAITPDFQQLPVICAAWLIGAEGAFFERFARHPAPKKADDRYSVFHRMPQALTSNGLVISAAEEKDVAKFPDVRRLVALLCHANADEAAFTTHLTDYLRLTWLKTTRAMKRDAARDPAWPYPGPLSSIACALIARRPAPTPTLPEELAPFINTTVIEFARAQHRSG